MKTEKWLVCMFILMLLTNGCSRPNAVHTVSEKINKKSVDKVVDKVTVEGAHLLPQRKDSYGLFSPDSGLQFRYYSPNGNNFCDEVLMGNDIDFNIVGLYSKSGMLLVQNEDDYFWEKYKRPVAAIWINNNEVVAFGKSIIDINTNTKKNIDFSDVIKEQDFINNYTISPDHNKLAYIIHGNNMESVWIYDIAAGSWQKIFEIPYHHNAPVLYGLVWSQNGDIYFGSADLIQPYPQPDPTKELVYKIYNFSAESNKISEYKPDYTPIWGSGDYLALYSEDADKTLIVDSRSNKTLIEFVT
ncbi:MAG: hypothetical protein ACM3UZ_05700 [Acidobacteriota bacterium]